jgi:hypothetical protein
MFDELMGRIAGRFARVEPRRRVRQFVAGLLAELPRTNCWTIAEHVGEATPYGPQHLLGRAVWDADAVRDDICGYVVGTAATGLKQSDQRRLIEGTCRRRGRRDRGRPKAARSVARGAGVRAAIPRQALIG